MKIGALSLALLGTVGTAAWADTSPTDVGEHIYSTICQGCHMSKGEGAVGAGFYPKLAGDPALASWQYVAVTVLNGRHGMPAFGKFPGMAPETAFMSGTLSDTEIAGVVNYVRSHFGNSFKDEATAKDVAVLPHPGSKGGGHAG